MKDRDFFTLLGIRRTRFVRMVDDQEHSTVDHYWVAKRHIVVYQHNEANLLCAYDIRGRMHYVDERT